MPETDYHELCVKLDNLAVRALELMEQILEERDVLNSSLKTGFVNIAKSRFLKGSQSVSILQITDGDIVPLRRVKSVESNLNDITYRSFKIMNMDELDNQNKCESALRHRSVKNIEEGVSNLYLGQENVPEKNKKTMGYLKDPLNWFGVLVPQSLRASQASFKDAITTVCNITSLQSELNSVREQYLKRISEKQAMCKKSNT